MDQAELSTEQVLQRDIPWETYMTTKLISATDLQLLRRYDKKTESARAQLLDEDGRAYVQLFVTILRDIFKEETVEYVLALIYEMLSANPARARLFHDQSLAHEDTYEPFLRRNSTLPSCCRRAIGSFKKKSRKILAWIIRYSYRPKASVIANGEASGSKKHITTIDDLLSGLVEWLCAQLRQPSHPTRGAPVAISCLSTLLKEPVVRSLFVQADGVKLLVPLISPASTQQSIQLLYETCLCIWLMSYYEPTIEYLATSRTMLRLTEVVKSSTKEKVVRDLLDALNQLEEDLKDKIRKLSSFDKYKQEVLLGHLDWNPMHKEANFWRENVTSFEENDLQILRVLLTILDTSSDPRSLAVACYDLSQFIQYHAAGRVIVTDLKAKERVMKLMAHENAEVTKNALLCIQRLLLGAKYASFLQV
ncbi:hypothetical protein HID58_057077 [Brassica napus]|uniref:ATPase V1 complex subunit H C-terminal domain-containing protein n=1 Tax=Brassica napus TaxID=3708 RepID=A0ABQ8AQ89_BRANA|nr:hypothetical protein HID58_057077 [Brassica napus]